MNENSLENVAITTYYMYSRMSKTKQNTPPKKPTKNQKQPSRGWMSGIWAALQGGSSLGRQEALKGATVNGYGFLFMSPGLEAAGSDTDVLMVIGIVGESVTFPLNIEKSQQVVNIVWNSETSVAFVTPGDPGTAPKVSVTHQNYNERINVSCQNYNLEIRNLRLEDSGVYKADINTKTAEGMVTTTRRYSLQVFRK